MQIGAHSQMLAALEVISQQSDGQLQQTAQDAKATVQKHLQHAEDLMKELEASSAQAANAQARS
jgi:predicted outer membrane protein